jgi:hypothetical protein
MLSQQSITRLKIDSLRNILLFAKDTQRINTLNLLSRRILVVEQTLDEMEAAANYSREALTLSIKAKYNKGIGNALLNNGIISVYKGENFQKNVTSLQIALPLLKQSGDLISVASCMGNIGRCLTRLGQNANAILFHDSAAHLFQQLGDTLTSAWELLNKAHSYFFLGNYLAAYKSIHTAQQIAPQKDTVLQTYALWNLAKLFLGVNLPETSIDCVRKIQAFYYGPGPVRQGKIPWTLVFALKVSGEAFLQLNQVDSAKRIADLLNIPLENQRTEDNLFYGHLYSAMRQPRRALIYFSSGYRSSKAASNEISTTRLALELARTYASLKNFSRAIYYGRESMQIARKINTPLEQRNAAGVLAGIYHHTGDYKKAARYNQLYRSLHDSYEPEEHRRRLSLIQVQNELEMQKKQAQLLTSEKRVSQQQIDFQQAELKKKSLLLYLFVAALITGLAAAALLVKNSRLKKRKLQLQQLMLQAEARLEHTRKEQLLTALQKEKTDLEMQVLRSQMNPHFIFNCLSSINRFILINKTEEAADYLTKFSRLMRMALHNSEKSFISLETELEALRLYLELERLRFRNAFDYSITLMNTIETSTIFIPPLLLQPFAENAIWHGLMHKKGSGHLDISLSAEGKILHCFITDNGIGRKEAALLKSKSSENNKSMGMQKTVSRLALLNERSGENAFFGIEDLVDEHHEISGTRVVLKIPYRGLVEAS